MGGRNARREGGEGEAPHDVMVFQSMHGGLEIAMVGMVNECM